MEWLKAVLEKHIGEDGKLNMTEAIDEVKAEAPKNVVPKLTFNEKLEDLKSANLLVKDLQDNAPDAEGLQEKIDDYELEVTNLRAERAQEKKDAVINEKLKEVGAIDLDYMRYKLGEVETDEEGNVVDLDNKVKALVEENAKHFEEATNVAAEVETSKEPKAGYQVLDNGLEDGTELDAESLATSQFEQALGLNK